MLILLFRELEATDRPIRVGMVGAGSTRRAIALQLGTPVPGMHSPYLPGIFQRRKPRRHSGILDSFPLQRRAPILNRQAMEFKWAQLYQFWLSHAVR
jgi:hypothetical protein